MGRNSERNNKRANVGGHYYSANKGADEELERIDTLFQQYADKDSPDVIGKMQAARQGYFTLEEWRRGLQSLKVDTIDRLKNSLPALEQEVMRPQSFPDFYIYSFQYCLTEERQKYLDMKSVCELLKVALGNRNPAQVESLVEFLKNQEECKAIILDQWQCFLRFFDEINYPSFENYDSTLAWPSVLDNYVQWALKKRT